MAFLKKVLSEQNQEGAQQAEPEEVVQVYIHMEGRVSKGTKAGNAACIGGQSGEARVSGSVADEVWGVG